MCKEASSHADLTEQELLGLGVARCPACGDAHCILGQGGLLQHISGCRDPRHTSDVEAQVGASATWKRDYANRLLATIPFGSPA